MIARAAARRIATDALGQPALAGGRRSHASRPPTPWMPWRPLRGSPWSPRGLLRDWDQDAGAGLSGRQLRRVVAGAAGEPAGQPGPCCERTGTSTNLLSKAAYDLVRHRERQPARPAARRRRGLCRDRARQGSALLSGRLRRRHRQRCGHRQRRDGVPGRRQYRRCRLRIRARPRRPGIPGRRPRLCLVRYRLGRRAIISPTIIGRVEPDERRDHRLSSSTPSGTAAGRSRCCSSASARRCTTCSCAAAKVSRDPPRRLSAGQPARDRAVARRAIPRRTTGDPSSATRCSARAWRRQAPRRSRRARH